MEKLDEKIRGVAQAPFRLDAMLEVSRRKQEEMMLLMVKQHMRQRYGISKTIDKPQKAKKDIDKSLHGTDFKKQSK